MEGFYQDLSESQIKKLLRKIVYGKHVFCSNCRSRNIYRFEDRYRCRKCRRSFSLFSGTWLKSLKLPLEVFWRLLWCWTQKVPVLQSQKFCKLSEPTVRHWFHIFRMQLPDMTPILKDEVVLDEAYFKSLSLVMGKQKGSRKIAHTFIQGNSVSRPDIAEFAFQYIQPESNLYTDGAAIYRGFDHWWPVNHQKDIHRKFEFGKTSEIEGMFGCLRTFIRRMYHHVTPEYLPEIVAEFAVRFAHPEMFDSPLSFLQKTIKPVPFD